MILISAAGSGGTNRLVEPVKEKFIGITADKYKLFSSVLKINILTPNAKDEINYIKKLNEIIQTYTITLFIPNSDIEVYVCTKYINEIKTKTFLPNFDLVDLTFDKWKLHQRLQELNIPSALTFNIQSDKDIVTAFNSIKKTPLWCRTRRGSGSKNTSKVINIEDARSYIKHCNTVYKIPIDEFLISEYLAGEDMAVMTIWKDNDIKMCKMAKRVRYSGEAGESAPNVIESFYDSHIEKFIINAIKKLKLNPHGILNIDIKCYEDGTPAITEINAGRFYYNMQLFNYGTINALQVFLELVNNKAMEFVYDDPEIIFIREQDNEPHIITKKHFNRRMMS